MPKAMDLFADALCQLYETGHATLHVERVDGFRDAEDISWYLTSYPSFPKYEKQALKFARGRVLDVGCGAGRHALYLQRRGLSVTAIDASPRLVELAHTRGVRDARVANACRALAFREGEFDTVLMLGNNLGICGTVARFRRMLRELHRVTAPRGRIIATTRMPSLTSPAHRGYVQRNIERGYPPGHVHLRLVFDGKRGAWFDLLLFSPTDLMQIASKANWELTQVIPWTSFEVGYAVVMEKSSKARISPK